MTAGPGHFRETKTGYFIPWSAEDRALISDAMNQAVSGRAAALGFLPGLWDQRGGRDLPVDHIAGDGGELAVAVPRVVPQQLE